jgi:hypothetical protein
MLWGKYEIQPGHFNILGVVLGATRKTFWKTFLEDLLEDLFGRPFVACFFGGMPLHTPM